MIRYTNKYIITKQICQKWLNIQKKDVDLSTKEIFQKK